MPLVDMRDLLHHARDHGYAIAAFDIHDLASLDGAIAAAESCDGPVALSIDAERLQNERRARSLLAAMHALAGESAVPVILYLKGAADTEIIIEAIRRGCNGVLADFAGERAASTAIRTLRDCGIPVGFDPVTLSPDFTGDPAPDFLPLASAEDLTDRNDPRPRVWHDDSDLSVDRLRQLLNAGVALIEFRQTHADSDFAGLIRQCGGNGRAGDGLAKCRPWAPVEHVIVYNVDGLDEQGVEAMMAAGREQLGSIPGVLDVFTGRALTDNPQFRYCWLVRFTHPAVIRSYATHPAHVTFADRLFRPVAGKRITIDFQAVGPRSTRALPVTHRADRPTDS